MGKTKVKEVFYLVFCFALALFFISAFAALSTANKSKEAAAALGEIDFEDENFKAIVIEELRNLDDYYVDNDYTVESELYSFDLERIETLSASGVNITACPELTYFTNLKYLSIDNNQLTALVLDDNAKLSYLDCSNNQLTALYVDANIELRYLDCSYNQLGSISVYNNTALETLICSNNQIGSMSLNYNMDLKYLDCSNNELYYSLDVYYGMTLETLICSNNQISWLSLDYFMDLKYLDCSNNQLEGLEVSNIVELETLNCSNNQISWMPLDYFMDLKYLDCSNNQLFSLDVYSIVELETLNCSNNQINYLYLSENLMLKDFDCRFNQLTSLEFTIDSKECYINIEADGGYIGLKAFIDSNLQILMYAQPYGYYAFIAWTDIEGIVSTDAGFDFESAAGFSLTANFARVPTAPTDFTVVHAGGYYTLSWSAPLDDGGSEILGYEVSSDNGATWVTADSGSGHIFSLADGISYIFKVRALNAAGYGAAEMTALRTPSAPQYLAAGIGHRKVMLSWEAPVDNGGSAILRYEVSSDGGDNWMPAQNSFSHNFTGLDFEAEYTFMVRAVNIAGFGETAAVYGVVPDYFEYEITASSGLNGSILPGSTSVEEGSEIKFTFAPNTGYEIDEVLIDGVNNITAVNAGSYTFSNVLSEHTISVTFKLRTYIISYNDLFDAINDNPKTHTFGDEGFTLCAPGSRPGYTFAGWYDAQTGGNEVDEINDENIDGLTVWARWSANTYTITYNGLEDAINTNSGTYTYGGGFSLANPSKRKGYTFVGWYDSEIGGNKITSISDTNIGDLELWARWEEPVNLVLILGIAGGAAAVLIIVIAIIIRKKRFIKLR
ncbi:MAG: fibronectin type III domain-containing protein [Firmicutes bacterium]|nr:fibronectin type III domain-containing protein [Bacillota bacterium]